MKSEMFQNAVLRILSRYDLGELTSYAIMRGGHMNLNIKLETKKGNYVLRKYMRQIDIAKIRYSNEVLALLKQHDFPVARPILTRDAKNIVEDQNGVFAIFEYIDGDMYTYSPAKLKNAAKTLARLHTQEVIRPTENTRIIYLDEKIKKLKQLSALDDPGLKKHLKRIADTIYYPRMLRIIECMHSAQEYIYSSAQCIDQKRPLSFIHKDFWQGQLIYNGDEVAALLDFDKITFGRSEYDLIKGLENFIITGDQDQYDFRKIGLFIDSYRRTNPDIRVSLDEILLFLHMTLFVRMNFLTFKLYEEGRIQFFQYLNLMCSRLEFLLTHPNKIKNTFKDHLK